MLALPASPRKRARLLWLATAGAVVGAVALVVVFYPNTGHSLQTPLSDRPATVLRGPSHVTPTRAAVREAVATLDAFVRSAVIRRNLASSWPLATRQMRVGVTRSDWLAGNLPVSPYPSVEFASASYKLRYSYRGVLGFSVIVRPRKRDGTQGGYLCELHRSPGRWLVDSCYGSATPHGRESPVINLSLGG